MPFGLNSLVRDVNRGISSASRDLDRALSGTGSDTGAVITAAAAQQFRTRFGSVPPQDVLVVDRTKLPLPAGWGQGVDGANGNRVFFIDHTNKRTTFDDPRLDLQLPYCDPLQLATNCQLLNGANVIAGTLFGTPLRCCFVAGQNNLKFHGFHVALRLSDVVRVGQAAQMPQAQGGTAVFALEALPPGTMANAIQLFTRDGLVHTMTGISASAMAHVVNSLTWAVSLHPQQSVVVQQQQVSQQPQQQQHVVGPPGGPAGAQPVYHNLGGSANSSGASQDPGVYHNQSPISSAHAAGATPPQQGTRYEAMPAVGPVGGPQGAMPAVGSQNTGAPPNAATPAPSQYGVMPAVVGQPSNQVEPGLGDDYGVASAVQVPAYAQPIAGQGDQAAPSAPPS